MHPKWFVVVGILMASVAGCAYGIKAASSYNGRVDFARYSTFFMLKGNSSGDALTDERLVSTVKSTLMTKGWLEVPEGSGQAAVVIHVATSTLNTYDAFYTGWGDWQWRWNTTDAPQKVLDTYKPGTVVVTVFDADTKQAIWRGFASDVIADKAKDAAKVREYAIGKLFKKFPPLQ